MKKAVIILLALTLLFSCLLVSCGDTESTVDTSSKSATSDIESQSESSVDEISLPDSSETEDTTSDDTVSDDTTIIFPKSEGQLLIEKTDEDYLKEANTAETTQDMVDISKKYADIYLEIADDYYNRIMSIKEEDWEEDPDVHIPSLEEFKNRVTALKTNWETYYDSEIKIHGTIIEGIHGTGTIRRPIIASYHSDLCREWAVKIIYIYEEIEPISR